jgi:hypothetical protein
MKKQDSVEHNELRATKGQLRWCRLFNLDGRESFAVSIIIITIVHAVTLIPLRSQFSILSF